jgi:hypothetical protein
MPYYNLNDRITLFGRYNNSSSTISSHNYSELQNRSAKLDSLTLGTTMTFSITQGWMGGRARVRLSI